MNYACYPTNVYEDKLSYVLPKAHHAMPTDASLPTSDLLYVEIKGQLDATDWVIFYCKTDCSLNMFRAPLCPSSGAQDLYRWLVPMVRSVFTHGPPGPGKQIKKSRLKYGMRGKKAVHEREI